MNSTEQFLARVLSGEFLGRNEALILADAPLDELTQAANAIRAHFCGTTFHLCSIINGKNGLCSEDCKYCAQSLCYQGVCQESYPLLPTDELLKHAQHNDSKGVCAYSIVTSGKCLSDAEVDQVCESIRAIRACTNLEICVSFGLMNEDQLRRLKAAGVSRVHCNLETSETYFPQVCTTHTFTEKVDTLKAAQRAGLALCSGGIIGLGETMKDRIDMALALRDIGVKSIPVNLLNPIPGTPYEHNRVLSNEELCRVVALFRFLIPDAMIRLAGGRGLLSDKGKRCFQSGANAAISGDMLTTAGITIDADLKLLHDLGYEVLRS